MWNSHSRNAIAGELLHESTGTFDPPATSSWIVPSAFWMEAPAIVAADHDQFCRKWVWKSSGSCQFQCRSLALACKYSEAPRVVRSSRPVACKSSFRKVCTSDIIWWFSSCGLLGDTHLNLFLDFNIQSYWWSSSPYPSQPATATARHRPCRTIQKPVMCIPWYMRNFHF